MHKILVLGGSGLVGTAVINEMCKYDNFEVYSTYFQNSPRIHKCTNLKLDIEDSNNISNILNIVKPNIVVSCLRGNFNEQLIAHIKIAEYLREIDGRLYFFSTTNVFDNDLSKPHYEDDLPNSHTDYGQYKTDCENKLKEILQDQVCILRIPQIWGKNSPRLKQLLKSLQNNEAIVIYPKFFLNTNTDVMIAKQLGYIINNNLTGTFHLAAEDVVNYKEFYNELTKGLGFNNAKLEASFEEEGCFALLSKRSNEFHKQLRVTNKLVIDYLID